MSDLIERTRKHVASYKQLTQHRQDCLDLCDQLEAKDVILEAKNVVIERLTAAAEQFEVRCLLAEEDEELARVDNSRLRAALERISEFKAIAHWPQANIALAALQHKDPDDSSDSKHTHEMSYGTDATLDRALRKSVRVIDEKEDSND